MIMFLLGLFIGQGVGILLGAWWATRHVDTDIITQAMRNDAGQF